MIIKNVELTLLKIDKREGVGKKSGKDYLFYNANVVDADSNLFGFILDEKVTKDVEKLSELLLEISLILSNLFILVVKKTPR